MTDKGKAFRDYMKTEVEAAWATQIGYLERRAKELKDDPWFGPMLEFDLAYMRMMYDYYKSSR